MPNRIATAATNREIGGKTRRKEAGGKRKRGKKKGGLWIFLGGPSWRGSSSGTIIMVFLCIFALHTWWFLLCWLDCIILMFIGS